MMTANKIWTKTFDGFSASMSALALNVNFACPCCGHLFSRAQLKPHVAMEIDVANWTFDCSCGQKLTIHND